MSVAVKRASPPVIDQARLEANARLNPARKSELAIELAEKGGELVAIIPRSFCNGLYDKPFREWILEKSSLEHIHLFHSRTSAFNDDEVLQENVIIKLVRGKKLGRVTITTSSDPSFSDLEANHYPFSEIVHDDDEQKFIHVPMDPAHGGISGIPLASRCLKEIGLEVSTGPVVDFRLKEFLREPPKAPRRRALLYPTHFTNGSLESRSSRPHPGFSSSLNAATCFGAQKASSRFITRNAGLG